MIGRIIAILVVSASAVSVACSYDTDCGYGSQCLKSGYSQYGICAGGQNPGNNSDRVPVRESGYSNEMVGNTCSYDAQCGYGHSCAKSNYNSQGVCM